MAFLHHCALESGWALPHHRSHDDPGERSRDDIGGKDKRQEQRPYQIAPPEAAPVVDPTEAGNRRLRRVNASLARSYGLLG
jgi:hypothetical protein